MIEHQNATVFYFNNKSNTVVGNWCSESDVAHINKYKRLTIDGQIVKLINMYIEPRNLHPQSEELPTLRERNYWIKQGLSNYTKPFSTFDFDKMIEENPEYFI